MKVIFRVDASFEIGNGHVIRCLTLAKVLTSVDYSVKFICRNKPGNLIDLIRERGFAVEIIFEKSVKDGLIKESKDEYENWLGVSEAEDAEETIEVISNDGPIDLLIVDHYSLSTIWEMELKKNVKNIMVIDDLANRKHSCKILLDQNWFENPDSRYDKLLLDDSKKLLGPKYALLEDQFLKSKNYFKKKGGDDYKLFVFFGGSDPKNLTSLAIKSINDLNIKNLKIDIVIGQNNSNIKAIKKIINSNQNIKLHIQINNIADLLKKSDFALGAAGINTWERICLGIPSIVISFSDNQKTLLEDLKKYNCITYLGDYSCVDAPIIKEAILGEMKKIPRRNKLFLEDLIDGKGSERVLKVIKSCI